jgi:hypothetical protein
MPTPRDFGHFAYNEKIGKIRLADGIKYIVIKTKFGKRWKKYINKMSLKKSIKKRKITKRIEYYIESSPKKKQILPKKINQKGLIKKKKQLNNLNLAKIPKKFEVTFELRTITGKLFDVHDYKSRIVDIFKSAIDGFFRYKTSNIDEKNHTLTFVLDENDLGSGKFKGKNGWTVANVKKFMREDFLESGPDTWQEGNIDLNGLPSSEPGAEKGQNEELNFKLINVRQI